MQIKFKIESKTLIVQLIGELDHHTAEQVRMMIEGRLTEQNVKNLIFDFSALSFMDSAGIGMMIGRYKQIKSLGGATLLICTSKTIYRLIEMSGLTRLIPVYANINQALNEIKEA